MREIAVIAVEDKGLEADLFKIFIQLGMEVIVIRNDKQNIFHSFREIGQRKDEWKINFAVAKETRPADLLEYAEELARLLGLEFAIWTVGPKKEE